MRYTEAAQKQLDFQQFILVNYCIHKPDDFLKVNDKVLEEKKRLEGLGYKFSK